MNHKARRGKAKRFAHAFERVNIAPNDGNRFGAVNCVVVNSFKRRLRVIQAIPGFDQKFPAKFDQNSFVFDFRPAHCLGSTVNLP